MPKFVSQQAQDHDAWCESKAEEEVKRMLTTAMISERRTVAGLLLEESHDLDKKAENDLEKNAEIFSIDAWTEGFSGTFMMQGLFLYLDKTSAAATYEWLTRLPKDSWSQTRELRFAIQDAIAAEVMVEMQSMGITVDQALNKLLSRGSLEDDTLRSKVKHACSRRFRILLHTGEYIERFASIAVKSFGKSCRGRKGVQDYLQLKEPRVQDYSEYDYVSSSRNSEVQAEYF